MRTIDCEMCGRTVARNNAQHRFCSRCGSLRHSAFARLTGPISNAVAAAIRRGELAHPKTLVCVDCGKPAKDYDHRDYSRPLDVDPVCHGCNRLRGPGANRPDYVALAMQMLAAEQDAA